MNQRKGGRKRQPHPVCPPATHALSAPPNRMRFAPFPDYPRASLSNNSVDPDSYQDCEKFFGLPATKKGKKLPALCPVSLFRLAEFRFAQSLSLLNAITPLCRYAVMPLRHQAEFYVSDRIYLNLLTS